jgi:hypothetical protein
MLYREAFSNPSVQKVLRSCSNVFLAGKGESGALTASLLSMGEQPKQLEDEVVYKNVERMKEEEQQRKSGKKGRKPRSIPVQQPHDEEEDGDDDANYDQRAIMGSEPHDDFERIAETSRVKKEEQEQLRMYVLAALVRVARRVCWGYMRQLWDWDTEGAVDGPGAGGDDVFTAWLQEDIHREKQLCEVSE